MAAGVLTNIAKYAISLYDNYLQPFFPAYLLIFGFVSLRLVASDDRLRGDRADGLLLWQALPAGAAEHALIVDFGLRISDLMDGQGRSRAAHENVRLAGDPLRRSVAQK